MLRVEVGQPIWDCGRDQIEVRNGNAVGEIAHGQPRQEALGDVLARRIIARVGGDEFGAGGLCREPPRRRRVIRIKRRVRRLVDERLFQDARGVVDVGLPQMDQEVVVPTSKPLHPVVNPDGL